MKKIIYTVAVALWGVVGVQAQDQFDAFRISHSDITGTARYMSMGGAFGALGGDASAIKDNPAGLGVFRSSELTLTINPQIQNMKVLWGDKATESSEFKFNFNQAAFVVSFKSKNTTKGLINSNISFQYNRIKNFNRQTSFKGGSSLASMTDYMGTFTNGLTEDHLWDDGLYKDYDPWEGDTKDGIYPGWLSVLAGQGNLIVHDGTSDNGWGSVLDNNETVTPMYNLRESGDMDEYSFSWGGNFSHKFYVGATMNLRTLDYSARGSYGETFKNGGWFDIEQELFTTGTGVNFGLGIIARPINFLRIGASFQTPTWMSLRESNYSGLESLLDKKVNIESPRGVPYSTYELRTPLKASGSMAFVLSSRGVLSVEYNYENYNGMKLSDVQNGREAFALENGFIQGQIQDVHTLKAGLEFNIIPTVAIRGGYALQTAGMNTTAARTMRLESVRTDTEYFTDHGRHYFSAGLGFRNRNWIVDLAYQCKHEAKGFYAYDAIFESYPDVTTPRADIQTDIHNIVLTLGYKF